MDFWTFHTTGDLQCDACIVAPVICEECGGILHSHFDEDLVQMCVGCEQCSNPIRLDNREEE